VRHGTSTAVSLLDEAFSGLWRARRMTFLSVTLITVSVFLVGAFLLVALVGAVIEKLRFGSSDDAIFDVALFVAAVASVAGALPGLVYGGVLLQGAVGELILCVAASGFAIYGRGYLIGQELPRPARPSFGYAS